MACPHAQPRSGAREHVKITKKAYIFQIKLRAGWKIASSLRKVGSERKQQDGCDQERSLKHQSRRWEERRAGEDQRQPMGINNRWSKCRGKKKEKRARPFPLAHPTPSAGLRKGTHGFGSSLSSRVLVGADRVPLNQPFVPFPFGPGRW